MSIYHCNTQDDNTNFSMNLTLNHFLILPKFLLLEPLKTNEKRYNFSLNIFLSNIISHVKLAGLKLIMYFRQASDSPQSCSAPQGLSVGGIRLVFRLHLIYAKSGNRLVNIEGK